MLMKIKKLEKKSTDLHGAYRQPWHVSTLTAFTNYHDS